MLKKDRDPIAKALSALTWLVQEASDDVGVRELASALQISPSSAHRLLSALVDAGFVRQDEHTTRYSLGLEFLRLCHLTTARMPIRQAALPHMSRLAEQCGETVILGLYDYDRHKMMFAATIDAPHPLRYVIELNTWLPVHAGASGLAIMAFLSDDEIDKIIREVGLDRLTDQTLVNRKQLLSELAHIRERGYAKSEGQRILGAVGLGAPILGSGGQVVGDICVTVPQQRFEKAREKVLADQIVDCARRVAAELGNPDYARRAD